MRTKTDNKELNVLLIKNELDLHSPSDYKHILRAWSNYIQDVVLIQDKQYKFGLLGTLKIIPSNVVSLRRKNDYVAMTEGVETVIHNNHTNGWVFRTKWDKMGSINSNRQGSNSIFHTTKNYKFRFGRDIRRRLYHLIKGGQLYV